MVSGLLIREYESSDKAGVLLVWRTCDLLRAWNNAELDIERKVAYQRDLFFVGLVGDELVATAMFGYDGHRGWLYYFGVLPAYQGRGYGGEMLSFGEAQLLKLGCPKLNFQVRPENKEVGDFYGRFGYTEEDILSFGKRLIED